MIGMSSCADKKDDDPQPEPFIRLLEAQVMKSTILQRDLAYAVILPPEYENSQERFPVVYLLHGYGDDETAWYRGGNIQQYIDMYRNVSVPAIYVMPEGFNNYWVNRYNGRYNLMDCITQELVSEIDRLYRTIPEATSRAVMGYSMGAYGALVMAAKNPGTFNTAIALSISFRTDEQYLAEPSGVFDQQWGSVFGGVGTSGQARLTDHFVKHSPFHFFTEPADPSLSGQNYFIDCGDDEETLSVTCNELHALMRDRQVKHEYRMRNGAHTWDYWHKALPEAFRYLRYAFQQIPYPDENPDAKELPGDSTYVINGKAPMGQFSVMLPPDYDKDTTREYPVIYILHDTAGATAQGISRNRIFQLFQANMENNRLLKSIIVEIPWNGPLHPDAGFIETVIYLVKQNYRVYSNGKYAVLAGNHNAGPDAAGIASALPGEFNACLLFEANLTDGAFEPTPDMAWYLDITDEGNAYTAYNALYTGLRQSGTAHEMRVRQGLPDYYSFLAGLNEACIFVNSQLKNK